ncbi:MAG: Prefoldin subunit alpha [Candidatus Thorarchaeota archaeon AB_25]|nr:MAG: Prefoldin subunit alpha [Candidatus Thorarchaeota archaeon AB_25]
MTEDQQKLLQKIYTEQQMTDSNLNLLQQRIEIIQVYITNYRSGLLVLEEIENKKDGEEMLMNVGGSIFVQAKIVNPDKVTRGLGSGIRIEQTVADAKAAVTEAVTSLEQQYETLTQEYQKLIARASVLNSQFQQLAAQIQGAKPPVEEE